MDDKKVYIPNEGSNYDLLSTNKGMSQDIEKRDNNKFDDYFDFYVQYLKYENKIKVEIIKLSLSFIFFICQLDEEKDDKNSNSIYTPKTIKNKIVIKDRKSKSLGEIEIQPNSVVNCVYEVTEDLIYIIICLDDKLYKISKNFKELELISDLKINKLLQINKNEYIISNDSRTYVYNGSILKITRQKLEFMGRKIAEENLHFGVFINQRRIVLVYENKNENKNKIILYNSSDRKIEKTFYYNVCPENCYTLLKCRIFNILDDFEIRNNVLLLGCINEEKYGYLRLDIETNEDKFIETEDFQISCFLQIKKNKKAIIEAFSVEYDKNYIYFLVCGYDHKQKENRIRLYKFYKLNREIEFVKGIGIKIDHNNLFEIDNSECTLKSIIQYTKVKLAIKFNKKEYTILAIMNLENKKKIEIIEEEVENGNNLFYKEYNEFYDKKNGYLSYELIDIDVSKYFKDISIKNIYQLENKLFIIEQEKKISIVHFEEDSILVYGNFKIKGPITCICEIEKKQVFFCQKNGLVKLVFSNGKDKVKRFKVNGNKFNFLSNKTKNDNYIIFSCDKGTFKTSKDIASIDFNKDLNAQNKIHDKTFDIATIIERNNNKYVILINDNNIGAINVNNPEDKYIRGESNCHFVRSINCIVSFKTKEDSNRHIFICATKKTNNEQKNGILALNIGFPLNSKILEAFEDTIDYEIVCMCPFNPNIEEEAFSPYFLAGAINDNYEIEINLYKIRDIDYQYENYFSIEFTKRIVYDKERMNSIVSIQQSKINGELIIFSYKRIHKSDIQDIDEEEEEE